MKLMIIKERPYGSHIVERFKGEIINYYPWKFTWQGMSEKQRSRKGIFVHCFGQGEFEVLRLGKDVSIYPQCFYINYRKNQKYDSSKCGDV